MHSYIGISKQQTTTKTNKTRGVDFVDQACVGRSIASCFFLLIISPEVDPCSNIRGNFFDRLTNLIPRHYVRHRLFGIRVNLHRFGIKFGVKCILQKDIICYIEVALLAAFHPWDQITRMTSWVLFVRMI